MVGYRGESLPFGSWFNPSRELPLEYHPVQRGEVVVEDLQVEDVEEVEHWRKVLSKGEVITSSSPTLRCTVGSHFKH